MHYYSFHISDFALHTSHLSLKEEAIYRKLLDYYYDTEMPIPIETKQVFRRLRLTDYADSAALVLAEFFVLKDDGWHNQRADFEIEHYHSKAETARVNGRRGGRPVKNNPAITDRVILANPALTYEKANQEPLTINDIPKQKTTRKVFKIPDAAEVSEYASSIGFSLDGEHFVDYYTTRGWKIGAAAMKDWKSAVRTWKRNSKDSIPTNTSFVKEV